MGEDGARPRPCCWTDGASIGRMALVLLGNMSRASTKCMKIFLNPLPKHCTYSRDPIDDSDSVAQVLNQDSAFFYDSFYNRRDVPTTTPPRSLGLDGCLAHWIAAIGTSATEPAASKK